MERWAALDGKACFRFVVSLLCQEGRTGAAVLTREKRYSLKKLGGNNYGYCI